MYWKPLERERERGEFLGVHINVLYLYLFC